MKLTKTSLKQFALVFSIMVMALVMVNSPLSNVAMAQLPIDPAQDCPPIIRALSGCATGLRGIVLTIVNFFLGFLGLLAVVMIIYAGFLYVGSAGNEENVGKAKKIILYAAIGIIVIIVSFIAVRTILGAGTGQPA